MECPTPTTGTPDGARASRVSARRRRPALHFTREPRQHLLIGLSQKAGQRREVLGAVEALLPVHLCRIPLQLQRDAQNEVMIGAGVVQHQQAVGNEFEHTVLVGITDPIGPLQRQKPPGPWLRAERVHRAAEAIRPPPVREAVLIAQRGEDGLRGSGDGEAADVGVGGVHAQAQRSRVPSGTSWSGTHSATAPSAR